MESTATLSSRQDPNDSAPQPSLKRERFWLFAPLLVAIILTLAIPVVPALLPYFRCGLRTMDSILDGEPNHQITSIQFVRPPPPGSTVAALTTPQGLTALNATLAGSDKDPSPNIEHASTHWSTITTDSPCRFYFDDGMSIDGTIHGSTQPNIIFLEYACTCLPHELEERYPIAVRLP